jgi:hypothetical protein
MKILFFLLIAFITIQAAYANTYCTAQWECQHLSENYNYVKCENNQCICKDENGFTGDATPTSRCHCPYPKHIEWSGNIPYCLDFDESVQCINQEEREEIMKNKVLTIYNTLVWPTPLAVINDLLSGQNTITANLFSPNSEGRVDPVGTYNDFDGVVEYFYGTVWLESSKVIGVNTRVLTASENRVSSRVDILLQFTTPQGFVVNTNVTQTGIFTFNDDDLVEKSELIIHNNGKANNPGTPNNIDTLNLVCNLIVNQAGCNQANDPDGFYTDFNDCVTYMQSIEFGTWDQVPADSVICRYYHAILALIRPNVHCSHSGKTGGGKCIDIPYADYWNKDYF